MPQIPAGAVLAGRTPSGAYWVDGFRYSQPAAPRGWLSFVEARDLCHDGGLELCSVEQFERICSSSPDVGVLDTWTTNYLPTGQVWTLGGQSCKRRVPVEPSDQHPARSVLCCQARVAVSVSGQTKDALAKSVQAYMGTAEAVMNARDPERILALTQPDFYLYNDKLRSKEQAGKDLKFDLINGSEFNTRLVRCDATISDAGQRGEFLCEAVTVLKYNTRPQRQLGFMSLKFRFGPPALKYDTWAVATQIVRNFKPLQ